MSYSNVGYEFNINESTKYGKIGTLKKNIIDDQLIKML